MKKAQKAQLSVGGLLLVVALVAAQLLLDIDLVGSGSNSATSTSVTTPVPSPGQSENSASTHISEDAIRRLIDNQISGEMVTLEAEIVKLLPDDNDGSRHQRLLLALESGGTVLVAHNIDLAPRVPADEGDTITVRGQYEWNDKGGVLHWTHHDPKEWREGGWIELNGGRYE
ncbi:MAG: DUF3465 domain-containing protein [Phycisphaera sp.]|nr:MAG: DUF3465 domain-containing protein [Phycisphaera sp.]